MLCVVTAVVAIAAFSVWSFLFSTTVPAAPGQPVQIEIPKGFGSVEIADLLANAGVVGNANMFRLRLRLSEGSGPLKAGVYDLTTRMDYDAVIARLREGPPIHYATVTIPEGWTIDQVAKRVEEKVGIPSAQFAEVAKTGARQFDYPFLASVPDGSLEGYLFPKTYRVRLGSDAHAVIDLMLQQFGRETAGLDLKYARSRGLTMHDVATIASMIERETKVQRDRPLVSSVIYNRLQRGMLLEIDATVQYVLGNKPKLTYKDLGVRSKYNTYLYKGLPPGPIANPGFASLQAAASPATTGYLYYVLTHKDGTHTFATTREEFLKLKEQARRGLK
ncbi:MAG TPA: endolytic transglycosylase MltG [Coriobacteriia bacterium]